MAPGMARVVVGPAAGELTSRGAPGVVAGETEPTFLRCGMTYREGGGDPTAEVPSVAGGRGTSEPSVGAGPM